MKTSKKGIDLIASFEGLRLKPYLCSAGVPTIGIGTTVYPDGKKVTLKDPEITLQDAQRFLAHDLARFEKEVNAIISPIQLNQNQFDAIVSFAYNLGSQRLKMSTLLKKIKANPKDASIRDEFMKWNKAGGQVLAGLTKRRKAEADLYFQ